MYRLLHRIYSVEQLNAMQMHEVNLIRVQEARDAALVARGPRRGGSGRPAGGGGVEREQVAEDGELGVRVVDEQLLETRLDGPIRIEEKRIE